MSRDDALGWAGSVLPDDAPDSVRWHQTHQRMMDGLHCLCGVQIAGWVPDERHAESRTVAPGHTLRIERMIFAHYPNYQEARIVFDDGSDHITHGCRGCLQNIREDTAAQFYARDLRGWAAEEDRSRYPLPNGYWAQMATRRPVSIRLLEVT